MIPRFETYTSTPPDLIDRRFVLVAYGEGRGKFKVKKTFQNDQESITYLVSSTASKYSEANEQVFTNLSSTLENVFKEGALSVSYVEGDALVEFPVEYAGKFDQNKLGNIAEMAVTGLSSLVGDFAEPLYAENISSEKSAKALGALQLCLYVVLCISFILVYYGNEVLPLDWISLTLNCLGVVFILAFVFRTSTAALFETGKIFTLCFLAASGLLLMLLIGVTSKHFGQYPIEKKEGIIESVLYSSKYHEIRIRLASNPNKSYLISKDYLKETPEHLPQAARFSIRPGFFGTKYVTELEIIR